MIDKHLWDVERDWRSGEERKCAKCGASVKFVKLPLGGSRIFKTITTDGVIAFGPMSKCRP